MCVCLLWQRAIHALSVSTSTRANTIAEFGNRQSRDRQLPKAVVSPNLFHCQTFCFSSLFLRAILGMPLWNGRSLRRNLALLCFILLFFYFSGRFVSRNTPPIVDDTFDTLDYVRPQGHQEMRPDGTLQVEWQQRDDPIDKESRIRMIDRKYCGRDRCRFMLPVAITEQG